MEDAAPQKTPREKRVILFGVDGSPSADFAIDWYRKHVRLSTDHVVFLNCAHLDMMHTSWNGTSNVFDHDAMSKLLTEEQKKIQATMTLYQDLMKETGMEGEVRVVGHSRPGVALCQAAEELGACLVVVGSRGHGALHRLLGSVSDYVLHHACSPVLICRQPHQHDKHHHHHHHHKHENDEKGTHHFDDKCHEKHHHPFSLFHLGHKHNEHKDKGDN